MRLLRILVVDDDFHIRESLRIKLEQAGHTVSLAPDGGEAVKALKRGVFDIVVTDILMPDKDGFELIGDIRRKWPKVRIVAISGGGRIGTEQLLVAAAGLGADAVIAKPFSYPQLSAVLGSVLSGVA
ncbi:MAG: response regulator [Opitutus sp.]